MASAPSPPIPQPSFIFEDEDEFYKYANATQESKENDTPLPIECWQHIISFLPLMDKLKCMKVNSMFRDVVLNSLRIMTKLVHTDNYINDPMNSTDDHLFRNKTNMKLSTLTNYMPLFNSLELYRIPDERLEHFMQQEDFTKLKRLKIRADKGLEDNIKNLLVDAFRYATTLNALSVSLVDRQINENLFDLFNLQLKELRFGEHFSTIADNETVLGSILAKILQSCRDSLKILDIRDVYIETLESPYQPIIQQISQFRNLREVGLPFCGMSETGECDKSPDEPTQLSHLASLTSLEKLFIPTQLCLHDVDIINIVQGCKNIRELDLDKSYNFVFADDEVSKHDDVVLPSPTGLQYIGNLENLEYLLLKDYDLSEVNMEILATKLKKLQTLHLDNCKFLLSSISAMAKRLISIRSVLIWDFIFDGWLAEDIKSPLEDVVATFHRNSLKRKEKIELQMLIIGDFNGEYEVMSGWNEYVKEKYNCSTFSVSTSTQLWPSSS